MVGGFGFASEGRSQIVLVVSSSVVLNLSPKFGLGFGLKCLISNVKLTFEVHQN